jgi:hypothetical protein
LAITSAATPAAASSTTVAPIHQALFARVIALPPVLRRAAEL